MIEEATVIKPKRSRLAQSRIDYIVYGNPNQVGKLVYDYGFVPPESLGKLSEAVHELIRSKGKKVIADLIKLHPDREVILSLTQNNSSSARQTNDKAVKEEITKPEEKKIEENKPIERKQKSECASCGKQHDNEDSYCGCSHAYNAYNEPVASKDNLTNLEVNELMVRYEVLSKQSLANPGSKALADEATLVWNEIRQRNQSQKKNEPLFAIGHKEAFIILSLTIIAGILVGLSLRSPRTIKVHE